MLSIVLIVECSEEKKGVKESQTMDFWVFTGKAAASFSVSLLT
jgi:hypothetical protein